MASFVLPAGAAGAAMSRRPVVTMARPFAAVSPSPHEGTDRTPPSAAPPPAAAAAPTTSRRAVLAGLAAATLGAIAGEAAPAGPLPPAMAAMYATDARGDTWTPKGDPSRVATYLPQLRAVDTTLRSLQTRWDTLVTNGDDVRRELGTVGLKSPLLNIRKTLEAASRAAAAEGAEPEALDALDDGVDFVTSGIGSVDYQVYSIGFTELEPTKRSLAEKSKQKLDEVVERYAEVVEIFEGLSK